MPDRSDLQQELPASSWPASLELKLENRRGGTRLTGCAHFGPLYVQKPFYPEGTELAHIYILHPPGGIVSGDSLSIEVDAAAQTAALLTTPGAARVYRAREVRPGQRQYTRLRAARAASLEWFPLETIVFDGAQVVSHTSVELEPDACFALWEISCFGRPASGELFRTGSFEQRYEVRREGRPLFIDRFRLDDSNRTLMTDRVGLQGKPVSGFFLMGPFPRAEGPDILDSLRSAAIEAGLNQCAAITRVGELLLGRYLGGSAEQARELFTLWWRILRPLLLGRPACQPRIWLT